jgi:hypothetical protein
VEVWFEYRSLKGLDMNERSGAWQRTPPQSMNAPGPFRAEVTGWEPGEPYEFRAAARHPVLTVYGEGKRTQ